MQLTIKEQVLRFVESKGSATFTECQRFIVDSKYGEGTYDSGATPTGNRWRGHFSSAFSFRYPFVWGYQKGIEIKPRDVGYFRKGLNRLEKVDGRYVVIRENVK
jgi:hypothetical protein